jgi:hypothetical protein
MSNVPEFITDSGEVYRVDAAIIAAGARGDRASYACCG